MVSQAIILRPSNTSVPLGSISQDNDHRHQLHCLREKLNGKKSPTHVYSKLYFAMHNAISLAYRPLIVAVAVSASASEDGIICCRISTGGWGHTARVRAGGTLVH